MVLTSTLEAIVGSMRGSSEPECARSSSNRRLGKGFWNTSSNPRQLHRNEDVLKGARSLDEETLNPGRVLRLDEDRAILEALKKDNKMGKVGETIGRATSRRWSDQTLLHLVMHLAFLAQSTMNSCQESLIL